MLRRRMLEVWVGVFIVLCGVSMVFVLFFATGKLIQNRNRKKRVFLSKCLLAV